MQIALNNRWLAYPKCVHSAFQLTYLKKKKKKRET